MIALFVMGMLLHGLNLVLPIFVRDSRRLNLAANLLNAVALLCGLAYSSGALLAYHPVKYCFALPAAGNVVIGFDGLSLFFLFTFQLLSLAGSLYAIGYLRHYIERGLSVRAHLWFFTLLIASLQLLAIAHNALLFLIVWEFMAVGAYFSIVFEKDREEVRRGGFWYFVATHASVLLLLVCFLTLHEITNSWNFDDFARSAAHDPKILSVILLTGFAGFAIKAGFMPFHVWLPNAHPAAPAHVSGLLSAINIKTGIYGIARLMMILPGMKDPAYGWGLLAVSLVSAVLGVWYALAQHDIKKLLAYHSVENIGIIGLGLSVAWLGRCNGMPELVVLGYAGALLHTLNHAIFKGLLFFGAGNVTLAAHGGDIEKMGGFARVIPLTAAVFLVGSISICGLPPFNGFVSEFLIYKSFFRGGDLLHGYAPLVMLFSAVGLAFMGGLAVACFTKLYGIVFLGQNRTGAILHRQSEPAWSSVAMTGLAVLCAVLGIFPQTGLRLIAPALGEFTGAAQAPAGWAAPLMQLQIVFTLFLVFVVAGCFVKSWLQRRTGVRLRETWGCGYATVTPRMQYTASGFAEELVKLGRPMLSLAVHWKPLREISPAASAFQSHCLDRMETGWLAVHRAIGRVLGAFRWIQSGNIRHYVLYMFAAVVFYLLCALVW